MIEMTPCPRHFYCVTGALCKNGAYDQVLIKSLYQFSVGFVQTFN